MPRVDALRTWGRGLSAGHGRNTLLALGAIFVLALGLRVARAAEPVAVPGPDSDAYSAIASHLYKTGEYGTPGMENESDWSPGAVLFYTGVYAVTGGVREEAARYAVALLGALLVLLVYALARRLARAASGARGESADDLPTPPISEPIAGLLAALAAAVYPAFVYDAGRLMSEPFAELALAGFVLAFLRASDPGRSPWAYALPGALLGLTALFRPEYLPFSLLFAALAAIWASRSRRRTSEPEAETPDASRAGGAGEGPSRGATAPQAGRISGDRTREGRGWSLGSRARGNLKHAALPALALIAAFALVIAPWTIRNAIELDRFVPVSTGGGKALFIGTYLPGDGDHYGTKRALFYGFHPSSELPPEQVNLLPMTPFLDAVAGQRPELDRDAALGAEGRENLERAVSEQPLDLLAMMGRKVWRMWRSGSGPDMDGVAPEALHAALCLLGLAGLALLASRRRREALALGLLAVGITAIGAVLLASTRRNLILMPLVISLAGVAVAWLLAGRGRASTVWRT
jgi:hypothetical protein